jgi:hypothetical protein
MYLANVDGFEGDNELFTILIKAVQELAEEIETLKAKLAA